MIDAAVVRTFLSYDPRSGDFVWLRRERRHFSCDAQWKNWNDRYPGTIAGSVNLKGYRAIAVLDHIHKAHRLAWLYVTGAWPTQQIDHINGKRNDNRFANLRDVSGAENSRNRRAGPSSKTGHVGVTQYPYHGAMKYVARVRLYGRLHHLGYFKSIPEAAEARAKGEERLGYQTAGPRPLQSRGFDKRGGR